MNENPYQSPSVESEVVGVKSGSREDLRRVATYQKGIMVCIVLYIVSAVGQFFVPEQLAFPFAVWILLLFLAGTVFVVLLAMKVYSTAVGVLLGVLTFIPCIGLFVLLAVNGKATSILKQNGIRVGLMGADRSQMESL